MDALLREILTDLKAAARLGHPEALETALEAVRALDDDQLPPAALVPLGRALELAPASVLRPLQTDPDPAVRALVAVGLAGRYLLGKDATPEDLLIPADDPNPEVRAALVRRLTHAEKGSPPPTSSRLAPLVEAGLGAASPTLQETALRLLPSSAPQAGPLVEALLPFPTQTGKDLRAALVACLDALAEGEHAQTVLTLLNHWAQQPDPPTWVITRALSAGWAQHHSPSALVILHKLSQQTGSIRPVARALARHEPLS